MTLEHLDTVISFVVIITGVSLLVTVLTQLVSAFLGLRGTNLRWGVQTLLKELDPSLKPYAAAISEQVLHHPLITDSTFSRFSLGLVKRWKLASSIHKEELIDVLRHLARQSPSEAEGAAAKPWLAALRQSLENLDEDKAEHLLSMAPQIRNLLPDDPAQADRIITQLTAPAEHLSANIDRWFDSVMKRVSQRFAVHARIWTILFSLAVALVLNLDAFRLLTQLSSDPELRARLVSSADALTQKADEILMTGTNAAPAVYAVAMQQLLDTYTNELSSLGRPTGITSLQTAKQWLAAQLLRAHIDETNRWLQTYETLVPQAALQSAAARIESILNDKLKFQLIPSPYPHPFYAYWMESWEHLLGILATAALLSLGAPFWFNLLKSLSNLRPALAKGESKG